MQGKRELEPKTLDLSPVVHVLNSQPFFESMRMLITVIAASGKIQNVQQKCKFLFREDFE